MEHKREGMVDLKNKRRLNHGCSKVTSYGVGGRPKRELCSEHKRDGMVNLMSKTCLYHRCSKAPS